MSETATTTVRVGPKPVPERCRTVAVRVTDDEMAGLEAIRDELRRKTGLQVSLADTVRCWIRGGLR